MFFSKFFLSLVVVTTIVCTPMYVVGQQVAVNELPDAPIPVMESFSSSNASMFTLNTTTKPVVQTKKHRWLTTYNASIATLVVGEVVDTLGTHRNMTHPKWICGFDSRWPTGEYAISTTEKMPNDEAVLEASLKSICGVSSAGVHPNYLIDVTQAGSFTEGAWAAKWKLTGNRNYIGVEILNIGNDVAQALVAHYLHRKGGWRGKLGYVMNFSHGIAHFKGGMGNFRYVSNNRTPDEWVENNPKLYFNDWASPRWWGKK